MISSAIRISLVAGCIGFGSDAVAQVTDGVLEEIVVTAQKRAENLQDVPLAISAFSETAIRRVGASTLADLAHVAPSVSFAGGNRRTTGVVTIRGVGGWSRNPGVNARASVYIDGVFVGRSSAFDQDLQQVTGVEILRGPQGTLMGKNSISGAVNINTAKPDENFEASIGADVGNFSLLKLQSRISGALSDSVFGSLAFTSHDQDGFTDNVFLGTDINNTDRIAARGKLRILPSDNFDLILALDFLEEDGRGGNGEGIRQDSGIGLGFGQLSVSTAPNPREADHDAAESEKREIWGASLTADYTFGNNNTFTSISAYREVEWANVNEEDYTSLFIGMSFFDEQTAQVTQEFRITSPQNNRFDYVAGLYLFDQDINTARRGVFSGLFFGRPPGQAETIPTFVDVESVGWAAYLHANYDVTDSLEISAGFRYSDERKDIEFFVPNPTGFAGVLDMTGQPPYRDKYEADYLTPKLGINYRINNDIMVYGSYSEGFTSGGHNVDFIQTLEELPFREETAKSYELGLKSTLFDEKTRLNVALFDTIFEDFQVFQFQQLTPTVSRIAISNAAEATTNGVEIDLTILPIDGLTLIANAAFIDASFDDFQECNSGVDCTGNHLPFAPEVAYFLSAQFEFSAGALGDVYLRADYTYTGDQFTHAENAPITSSLDSYDSYDARIGIVSSDGKVELAIWGKNLADSVDLRWRDVNFFGAERGRYVSPLTYGISANYNF